MQLAILTAVLGAIAAAEIGGGPVHGIGWRLASILAAALASPLAAYALVQRSALFSAAGERDHDSAAKLETIITGLWLAAVVFILFVGQWPRMVRANWQLDAWPLVDEIAILLPVITPLFLIWAVLYRSQQTAVALGSESGDSEPSHTTTLSQYLLLQARHHLAVVLLPPLAVVGLIEAITLFKIAPHIDVAWWFVAPQLAIVLVLMPMAVRRLWQTTPLRVQPLRQSLDDVCRSRGVRLGEILIWHTRGTMANAAVVGVSRFLRYLLLSDALIWQLSSEQLAAVVRHELAHVRRWHLPLRLALLMLPVAWWLAARSAFPSVESQLTATLSIFIPSATHVFGFVAPLGMLAYAVVAVGRYSRTLEHDADIDACLDDHGRFDPLLADDFCAALTKVCADSGDSWLACWLHPSLTARISLLNRLVEQPTLAAKFRHQTNAIAIAIGVLYAIAGITMLI